eukprot:TRINITY_DN3219_c0_g2_i1.p1 TRINITY_DN3219_c0_g2~~TRINITY_DN3219_c0_g2_i1.p1  ORF type:complete len:682 (+),score=197.30 TRINITY_DN3219_c0_g2_i1:52-2046(+)
MAAGGVDPRDTIKILLATDNHLGAFEKLPVRANDPFTTFEEILRKAHEHDVDMILLGGDLFDENKPSLPTLHRTMALLRKYCMGSRRVDIRMLSDPTRCLSNGGFGCANFQDPNLNVAYPVFAIHGNHDNPVSEHQLSAMDLLSVSGLVNYFGKAPACDDIEVPPVLLAKGRTKLALYGIGHVRDERLHRSFEQGNVKFLRPKEAPGEWFNVLVLHQNRGLRSGHMRKNGIDELMLEGFHDLVIWAHEHECKAHGERATGDTYDIIQPGSSVVAGPKSEDDASPKKVCLLEVCGDVYRNTPITLQSCRPVQTAHVVLADEQGCMKTTEDVTELLAEKVEELIMKSKQDVARMPDEWLRLNPTLKVPLVRVKVDYSPDYPALNPAVFGGRFLNRVADPRHTLWNLKRRTAKPSDQPLPAAALPPVVTTGGDQAMLMGERIAEDILKGLRSAKPLTLLSESLLTDALRDFVDKGEGLAMHSHIEQYLERAHRTMWRQVKKSGTIRTLQQSDLRLIAQQIRESAEEEYRRRSGDAAPAPVAAAPPAPASPPASRGRADDDMPPPPPRMLPAPISALDDDCVLTEESAAAPEPKKGRRRQPAAKPSAKPSGRGRGRRRIADDDLSQPTLGFGRAAQAKRRRTDEQPQPVRPAGGGSQSAAAVLAKWGR